MLNFNVKREVFLRLDETDLNFTMGAAQSGVTK